MGAPAKVVEVRTSTLTITAVRAKCLRNENRYNARRTLAKENTLMSKSMILFVAAVALALGGLAMVKTTAAQETAKGKERVFELRTYTAAEGKLDALNARFRDHTNKLFVKHGMELIGYWTPADGEKSKNTLIYILAHASREAAAKSWKDFRDDPDWKAALADSEKDGKLTTKVESVFMKPTDYSPMK
jgi:hypothetical protein